MMCQYEDFTLTNNILLYNNHLLANNNLNWFWWFLSALAVKGKALGHASMHVHYIPFTFSKGQQFHDTLQWQQYQLFYEGF